MLACGGQEQDCKHTGQLIVPTANTPLPIMARNHLEPRALLIALPLVFASITGPYQYHVSDTISFLLTVPDALET